MNRALLSLIGTLALTVLLHAPAFAWTPPLSCTGPLGETTVSGDVLAGAGCDLTDTTVNGSVVVLPGGTLGIYPSPSPTATTPTTGTGTTKSKARIQGYVLSFRAGWIEIRAGWIGGGVLIGSTTDDGANGLLLENATIDGDVLLRRGKAYLFIQQVSVSGDVYVVNNKGTDPTGQFGFVIGLSRSSVAGNVILYNNEASGAFMNAVGIVESTIGKDLLVQGNVARNATDQNLIALRMNVVGGNLTVNGNRAVPVSGNANSALNSFIEVARNIVAKTLACRDNTPDPVLNGTDPAQFNTAAVKKGECAGL
jgi:hypothetical protein